MLHIHTHTKMPSNDETYEEKRTSIYIPFVYLLTFFALESCEQTKNGLNIHVRR